MQSKGEIWQRLLLLAIFKAVIPEVECGQGDPFQLDIINFSIIQQAKNATYTSIAWINVVILGTFDNNEPAEIVHDDWLHLHACQIL